MCNASLPEDVYWVPRVNQLRTYGPWAFAEFTDNYRIEAEFNRMLAAFGSSLAGASG
jgi:type III restriction enzyme